MRLRVLALAAVVFFGVAPLASAAIIYSVDRTVGAGSVVGTITTDGTVGVLGTANIIDWDLTLTDANSSFVLDGLSNSARLVAGSAFTATLTELLFDFSLGSGFVLFQNPSIGSGDNFWCLDNGGCINEFVPGEYVVAGTFPDGSGESRQGIQVIASAVAPEPATLLLFGAAFAAEGIRRSRRQRA